MDCKMRIHTIRVVLLITSAFLSLGASWRSENFIAQADNEELARECCDAAERARRDIAIQWLGRELPAWSDPCPIRVEVGEDLGAGGSTQFQFEKQRPFGWSMQVQGSRARLLDSVIPHEVAHTVFATHFGGPLPRWVDEGVCTMVEAEVEQRKHRRLLLRFVATGQVFRLERLLSMREYPPNVLPLFSQGYSLSRFLVGRGSRRRFLAFVKEGVQDDAWAEAARKYYGFEDLADLEHDWQAWVSAGSPDYESLAEPPQTASTLIGPRKQESSHTLQNPRFGTVLFTDVTSVRFRGPGFPATDEGTFDKLTTEKGGAITVYERYIVRDVPQTDGAIRRSVYAYDELGGFEQLLRPTNKQQGRGRE
jgi:hypothetical protein